MVGIAQPYGVHPDKLAYRQLLLSLTSIQTTIIAFTHATYDLRAHGQCFEPLRSEIQGTLGREDWEKVEIHQMRSLESFLKEFRRVNPPSLCNSSTVPKSRGLILSHQWHLKAS